MADNRTPLALSDRYVLLDRIGSGGMGTVWRATDQLLNRTVAVKETHVRATGDKGAEHSARARREAHAIARISHPNVVNIHDLVFHDERLWLVMEFVDGPSLKQHVADNGPMDPAAVAGIGLQLLSALEAVHAAGALHRDIKPGNILLRRDGRAILCDFGIAALAGSESLTASGAVVGSFEYIAPERLSGLPVGPPSDLFSLGVTLCVLLSGRSPFARPEPVGVLNAVIRDEPDIPASAGPLRPSIEALLRKNPADRPSVEQASEMLRPLAATAPDTQRFSLVGAVPRRRLLGVAAVSAAGLAAAAVGAGALMSRSGAGADSDAAGTSAHPAGTDAAAKATNPTRTDAVLPVPDDPDLEAPGYYWMFSGDRYLRARMSASGYPVGERLSEPSDLDAWKGTFQSLPGFRDRIDATLRVPGSRDEYWVFSGSQYLRMRIAGAEKGYADTLVTGPRPLRDWADAFGELAGGGIDAVMRTPDDQKQYWVFAGDRYVRTRLAGEGPGGEVAFGPSGFDGWAGTFYRHPAFKHGIDAAMPVPGERNDYWVFAGTQYMKIRVADETYADTVVDGPRALRDWSTLQ
ncbi:protein kinase domain-containing protein [Nonomuraea sp. KM88]|uniref:protein kinase domain-containing protein n=1 Tax=Nonomuraea sp. KM88 TaxID=3457427 RepID=UPI003FCE4271